MPVRISEAGRNVLSTRRNDIFTATTIILTLVNATALIFSYTTPIQLHKPLSQLDRPSQYPGLESINYDDATPYNRSAQILFPFALAQVDKHHPDQNFPANLDQYFTRHGSTSSNTQHLVISESVSPAHSYLMSRLTNDVLPSW